MRTPHWAPRAGAVVLAALGAFFLLCLLTYDPADLPLLTSSPNDPPRNLGGAAGSWVGLLGRAGFGWASLWLPIWCAVAAWRLWSTRTLDERPLSLSLATLCLLASTATLLALPASSPARQTISGGLVGHLLAHAGSYYLGWIGTALAAGCIGLLSWLVLYGHAALVAWAQQAGQWVARIRKDGIRPPPRPSAPPTVGGIETGSRRPVTAERREDAPAVLASPPRPPEVQVRPADAPSHRPPVPARRPSSGGFQLPSLELLNDPPPISERQITEDLRGNARVLEETLREFGVEANVVNIDRGPTITRYELTPAPGVKLTRIVSLADELALVLKTTNCSVLAPIPGKGRVGIDVPNTTTTIVYVKELLAHERFARHASPLALPVGKDVSGHPIVADLRDCPHLLIAGATGSGKTVCLNSLLTGILYHAPPEQVRFLMIDPKMVELSAFNHIPHLIAPVVTQSKRAAAALHWAVREMERRYELFAKLGVRNIELYNARVASPRNGSEAEDDDGALEPLAYIVVVIDELADLMMASAQEVESSIARLTQLSRAVGLHIILATQRPSVDVITGVIKANFPARLAFQVASKVDSRTILDMNGADKLLGRGDLLFLPPGAAKPVRAQGAFVTDAEIERVTTFLRQQQSPVYDPQLLEPQQPDGMTAGEHDDMYEAAKQLVLDTGQASTSLLQRRLRLGYGRAARILDVMEQEGIVGPPQGSRPREVLVTRQALEGREAS